MNLTILGDKSEDSSVGQMAVSAKAALEASGFSVSVVSKVEDAVKAPLCVNLMMKQAVRLHGAKRYGACRTILHWYAQNPENFSDSDVAGHLLVGCQDRILVQSAHLQNLLFSYMTRVFSASQRRIIQNAMVRLDYGIGDEFTDAGENLPTQWVAPFNRVNETFKRFSLHAAITTAVKDRLRVVGLDTTHVFVRAKDMGMGGLPEKHPYLLQDQPDRSGYVQAARRHGFFISTSRSESYGLYYVELLHSGVVGLFLDAPWVAALLPDYPYVFKTRKELELAAFNLGRHHDKAKAGLCSWLHSVGDRYRSARFYPELATLLRGMA